MFTKTRSARVLLVAAALGAIVLASCTPEEIAAARAYAAHKRANDKFHHVLSDAGLARLRACESGGNYRIVSANGLYRGAYQFSRATWNGVAARHYPHLNGVDPAKASAYDQDRMARALWAERGRQPWPVCGRRV
ncbi:MAG TPA: transglycosylase family protein [Microthrixaceae bacterium]|jgi:hypothetical protein|nr:transglycosylase family protein [Microthrixaceae bacterium]